MPAVAEEQVAAGAASERVVAEPPKRLARGSAPLVSSRTITSLPDWPNTWMSAVLATVGVPPRDGDRAVVHEDRAGRVAADRDRVGAAVAEDGEHAIGKRRGGRRARRELAASSAPAVPAVPMSSQRAARRRPRVIGVSIVESFHVGCIGAQFARRRADRFAAAGKDAYGVCHAGRGASPGFRAGGSRREARRFPMTRGRLPPAGA